MQLEQKEILIQIKDFEDRLSHMRDLLARQQIGAENYREIKSQYNIKISIFESRLTTLNNDVGNVKSLTERGLAKIMEINHNLKMEAQWRSEMKLVRFTLKKCNLKITEFKPLDGMISFNIST